MFERLLLAIDDTPAGQIAVSVCASLARQHRVQVHVFHVNQFVVGGRGVTVIPQSEAVRLVEQAIAELKGAGVDVDGAVSAANCFDLAARIAAEADRWSADAIVLGSQRHARFARLRGRGLRERLIQRSTLPVVVAPAPLRVAVGATVTVAEATAVPPSVRS